MLTAFQCPVPERIFRINPSAELQTHKFKHCCYQKSSLMFQIINTSNESNTHTKKKDFEPQTKRWRACLARQCARVQTGLKRIGVVTLITHRERHRPPYKRALRTGVNVRVLCCLSPCESESLVRNGCE